MRHCTNRGALLLSAVAGLCFVLLAWTSGILSNDGNPLEDDLSTLPTEVDSHQTTVPKPSPTTRATKMPFATSSAYEIEISLSTVKEDPSLSSSSTTTTNNNNKKNVVCLFPVGDSLTQGVGTHGSYREHLVDALHKRQFLHQRRVSSLRFVGSKMRTCVVGKPYQEMSSASEQSKLSLPHEGHCSLPSWSILRRLTDIFVHANVTLHERDMLLPGTNDASALLLPRCFPPIRQIRKPSSGSNSGNAADGGGGGSDSSDLLIASQKEDGEAEAVDEEALTSTTMVLLLLMGHNDAFHAARKCKIKEWTSLPSAIQSAVTANPTFLDTYVVTAGSSAPAWFSCALMALREEFERNIVRVVELVKRRATLQSSTTNKAKSTRRLRVIVGLNPPTGFPALDMLLHSSVRRAKALLDQSSSALSLNEGTEMQIQLVPLHVDFKTGVHTFDTTHPNKKGARFLADRWAQAIMEE